MPKLALLLCLSISGVATPVFGQEASDEARFSMRSFNLSMSEKMLTSRLAKPDEAALAIAANELWEFEQDITAFQEQGRDLTTFLFLRSGTTETVVQSPAEPQNSKTSPMSSSPTSVNPWTMSMPRRNPPSVARRSWGNCRAPYSGSCQGLKGSC